MKSSCVICSGTGSKLDSRTGRLVACPRCHAEQSQEITESLSGTIPDRVDPLWKRLGFQRDVALTGEFNFKLLATELELKKYTPESVETLRRVLHTLHKELKTGEELGSSFVIGLPQAATVEAAIYPLMVAALEGMHDFPPLLTANEVRGLTRSNYYTYQEEFRTVLNQELAFVLMERGLDTSTRDSVLGLVEARGIKGNCTILITREPLESFEDSVVTDQFPEFSTPTVPLGYFVEPIMKVESVRVYSEPSPTSHTTDSRILPGFTTI